MTEPTPTPPADPPPDDVLTEDDGSPIYDQDPPEWITEG